MYTMMRLQWAKQEVETAWKNAKGLLSRTFHMDGHVVCQGS